MQRIKNIAFVLFAVSLAGCATERAAPPPDSPVPVVSAPAPLPAKPALKAVVPASLSDAEHGLRSAVEAYAAGNARSALIAARAVREQKPGHAVV